MALLNELLEDAAARCHTLSQEAAQAVGAIDQLVDHAEHLAAQVEAAAQDVRERMHELAEEMGEAERAVAHGAEEAEHRLQALAGKAAELRGRVGGLLESAGHASSELSGRAAHTGERLHQEAQEARDRSDAVLQELAHLHESSAARLEKVGAALQAFTETVSHAQQDWDAKQTALLEAMDAMVHGVHEKVQAYADEVADLLDKQRIEVLVEGLANEMVVESHNQAIDALGQHFEDEAAAHAQEAATPLRAALSALVQACEGHAQALGGKAAEIETHARAALQEAETMRPTLEEAARLP